MGKSCVRYQTAHSQISIQVLYGRLTKVSRIIFQLVTAFLLYLSQITNLHSLFANRYTLRV